MLPLHPKISVLVGVDVCQHSRRYPSGYRGRFQKYGTEFRWDNPAGNAEKNQNRMLRLQIAREEVWWRKARMRNFPPPGNDARHKRQKLENAMSALTRRQKLSAAHKTSPSGRPSISSLDQYDCEPLASCKSPAPDASRQTVFGPADPEKTTEVRTVCDPVRETALAALGKVDVNGNKDARHPIAVKIRVRLDTTILLDHSFSTPLHRVHSEHSRILRYAVAASKEWANDTQTDWNDVAHLWYVESRNGKKEVTGLEGALGFMNGFTEYEDRDLKLVVIHMYPRFPKVGCERRWFAGPCHAADPPYPFRW
ncbi:hypothetical protein LTR66_008476 [Elasticomyces elasticus]|nr:hypothetical protein LTR66_008476 [Elasticomyces elasticus]